MEKKQLRQHLDQLTHAIEGMDASTADRDKLVDLVADIERQLIEPDLLAEPESMVDQLDSMVSSFETDHPAVAGILSRIMVTLTSMGV